MSLNKNLLRDYMITIIGNTVQGLGNPNEHYALKSFIGTDATVSVGPPGFPSAAFKMPDDKGEMLTLTIVDEGCAALEKLVTECSKDDYIGTYVGRRAIEKEIQTILRQWFGETIDEAVMLAEVRAALKRLRDQVKAWTVYFSIENLTLKDVDSFALGGVQLLPVAAWRSNTKVQMFKRIDASASDAKVKHATKVQLDDQVSRFYPEGGTVAVLTVNAEQSRLRDVVDHALSEVLGLLRGFTHLLFPRDNRSLFNVKGWLINNPEMWIGLAEDAENWSVNMARAGALLPYELTQDIIEHLRNHCELNTFHNILCRKQAERTQLGRALIVAAQWHGTAVNAPTPAEEFVWHTVAIERLLICDKETSTTDRFSSRLAWLLGTTGAERQYLSSLASRLYDIRSCIEHAGETRVESEHLEKIDYLASRALIALAERTAEWTKQEELREWVAAQLMGA